ncbi:MAG TPA: transporter substrate-binding domain-containing protein, partial [Candidatus Limnocylindrales bacterium]|nr:transporter substrate-binding domain-containing protein [Candidatus Limnocylindrales bacterium]
GGVSSPFSFATLAVAAVAIVAATVLIRPALFQGPAGSPEPDLLARLREQGSVRFAVTGGHPQTTAAGGAVIGFDVDVARALAEELGLRGDIRVVSTADILAGRSEAWDIALPSSGLPSAAGFSPGPAYYEWPSWLVVLEGSAVQAPADLEGQVVCGVTGTASLAWLEGDLAANGATIEPPSGATALERASDESCIEALRAGDAVAAVTAELLDDELAGLGIRGVLDQPVVVDRRGVLVRGTPSDVASLVEALDVAMDELRASGRLAAASRSAFGGRDLTEGIR